MYFSELSSVQAMKQINPVPLIMMLALILLLLYYLHGIR